MSTLFGRVVGSVRVVQGDREEVAMFGLRPVTITGGAPRLVSNPVAVAAAWTVALSGGATREGHRRAMSETWRAFAAGAHPDPDAADCLLRHHTELPVDWAPQGGRSPFWLDPARTIADAVADLPEVPRLLADADRFSAALARGLTSRSLARRDLAWRLMRLPS